MSIVRIPTIAIFYNRTFLNDLTGLERLRVITYFKLQFKFGNSESIAVIYNFIEAFLGVIKELGSNLKNDHRCRHFLGLDKFGFSTFSSFGTCCSLIRDFSYFDPKSGSAVSSNIAKRGQA